MTTPTTDTLGSAELDLLKGQKATPSGTSTSRFLQRCHDWLADWISANAHPLGMGVVPPNQVVVFVFSESPELEKAKFAKMGGQWDTFYPKALDQLTQGVVIANENMRVAFQVAPTISSIADAFTLVKAHLGAGDAFAITQLSQKRLLFHAPGDDVATWCDEPTESSLTYAGGALSAAKIEADIDNFHKAYLLDPKSRVARTIWKGKKFPYKLNPHPEQSIQIALFMLLRGSYPHLRGIVDEEVNDTGGRCDLRVQWPSQPGAPYQPHTATMMELKVLYNDQGTHTHEGWVQSGINQAHGYRTPQTEAAYACIFDARKTKTSMSHLQPVAKGMEVELRIYPMKPPAFTVSKSAGKAAKAKKAQKKAASKTVKKQKAAAKVAKKSAAAPKTKGGKKK